MTSPYLVIGGSGFIGSHILRELSSRNIPAFGTRANSPGQELLAFDLRTMRIGDCLKALPIPNRAPLVAVICSSLCQIDRCYRERALSFLINVEKTRQLIDDLADWNARIVFLSTSHVFDGEAGPHDENSPTCPISEYGRQKLAIERYLEAHPIRSLILRLDKIVGSNPQESHLFTEWQALRIAGGPIRCIQGQMLSPTLVDDVAKAVAAAVERNLTGLYHVANPEHFERAELARLFLDSSGDSLEITEEPLEQFSFADQRPLKTWFDGSRFAAATALNFTPMRDVIQTFLKQTGQPSE